MSSMLPIPTWKYLKAIAKQLGYVPWMVARVLLLMSAGLSAQPRPPGVKLSRAPLDTWAKREIV